MLVLVMVLVIVVVLACVNSTAQAAGGNYCNALFAQQATLIQQRAAVQAQYDQVLSQYSDRFMSYPLAKRLAKLQAWIDHLDVRLDAVGGHLLNKFCIALL
jgi:hypothetical protein